MSAESPRKASRFGGHVIAPQPVSDRSIIESVAGFINEVVPQGYSSLPLGENKELITWARFEYGDINDPAFYPDTSDDRNGAPPLLLVLGYGTGVQVWAIPASGEAIEVLSWRQGVVRTLRILPTPLANSPVPDQFAHKRPLVALCDSSTPGPQFCSISFISLRGGDQVKSIKFKNPVNDVLANGRSVVVSFPERIAVFDASTLEDRFTITTCYPCPGPNPNPVSLGSRWLAYAERRVVPSKRCSGGSEGEGIQSYTATVIHAAKSLGKGLRELGETVASSLTGGPQQGVGARGAPTTNAGDPLDPGVVTIIDAQGPWKENGRTDDNVIAHFTAHAEPVVALQFDPTGVLLVTADKRGHDFHLFRIQPHPGGSQLSAVHHLYILHRGDTTAKVQDIAFASDSRWVAVSTLRGTTHVFPVTPYGGTVGLRTHSTPHVVNRLSRFHRSAGLTADGRNSPQPMEVTYASGENCAMAYANPRLPPYPHPTTVAPLAQIRQPMQAGQAGQAVQPSSPAHPNARMVSRNHSVTSEDSGGIPLRVSACFAPSRAWLVGSPTVPRDNSNRPQKKAVESLFVMACHGSLIEYELETKHATGIPKEKVCDDTAIELEVHAKAQWVLLRPPQSSEVQPPLSATNILMSQPLLHHRSQPPDNICPDERWLSHVEIITHSGPHRRLWMGPQFTFKTYTANPTNVSCGQGDGDGVEIGSSSRLARSNPVNMPLSNSARPVVPFLIESGSAGSYEQSPRLVEVYGGSAGDSDSSPGLGETQLREELADAMLESPGVAARDTGRRVIVELRRGKQSQSVPIEKIVNPVGTVLTVLTSEGASDGKQTDGEKSDTTVRWPTDVVRAEEDPKTDHQGGELISLETKTLSTLLAGGDSKWRKQTDKNTDKQSTNQKRRKTSMEMQCTDGKIKTVGKSDGEKREGRCDVESVLHESITQSSERESVLKQSSYVHCEDSIDLEAPPEAAMKICDEFEGLSEKSLKAKKSRVRPKLSEKSDAKKSSTSPAKKSFEFSSWVKPEDVTKNTRWSESPALEESVAEFVGDPEREDSMKVDLEAWDTLATLSTKLQETVVNPRCNKKTKKSEDAPAKEVSVNVDEVSSEAYKPELSEKQARKYQGLDLADIKVVSLEADFQQMTADLETKTQSLFSVAESLDARMLSGDCDEEKSSPDESDVLYRSSNKLGECFTPASSSSEGSDGIATLPDEKGDSLRLWSTIAAGRSKLETEEVNVPACNDDDTTNGDSETPTLLQAIKKNKKKNKKRR